MTKLTRLLAALAVGVAVASTPVARPAEAACRFATAGRGRTLLVGVDGQAGSYFVVNWGDGLQNYRMLSGGADDSTMSHEYATDGSYTVRASVEGPAGCAMRGTFDVPYDDDASDETSQTVLPPEYGPPAPADVGG